MKTQLGWSLEANSMASQNRPLSIVQQGYGFARGAPEQAPPERPSYGPMAGHANAAWLVLKLPGSSIDLSI